MFESDIARNYRYMNVNETGDGAMPTERLGPIHVEEWEMMISLPRTSHTGVYMSCIFVKYCQLRIQIMENDD